VEQTGNGQSSDHGTSQITIAPLEPRSAPTSTPATTPHQENIESKSFNPRYDGKPVPPENLSAPRFNASCNPSAYVFGDNFVAVRRALSSSYQVNSVSLSRLLEKGTSSDYLDCFTKDAPALLWLSIPGKFSSANKDRRLAVAFTVLATHVLDQGGDVVLEGHIKNQGWGEAALQPLLKHPRLRHSLVNWCQIPSLRSDEGLGIQRVSRVVSTTELPTRLEKCCGEVNHISARRFPERIQGAYFREVSLLTCSGVKAESFESTAGQSTAGQTFATLKTKKSKVKAPQPELDPDEPGEHAETRLLHKGSQKVACEEVWDDCGDNVDALELPPENSMFIDENSDSELSDEPLDQDFMNHWLVGSGARADTTRMASLNEVLAFLAQHPGQELVCELFGGKGATGALVVRKKMGSSSNYDLCCGIDLTSPREVSALLEHVATARPLIIIAGPPCTSFSSWSRLNRSLHYETWVVSRTVGERLARLVAMLCNAQLQHQRHFLVEHPAASEMWAMKEFQQLLQDRRVHQTVIDQCAYGLADAEGTLIKKSTRFMSSHPALLSALTQQCPQDHQHSVLAGSDQGVQRTKQAQVWPAALVTAIVQGISKLLKTVYVTVESMFPARQEAASDAYGGQQLHPTKCRGCVQHLRRDDVLHDRREGICKYPGDQATEWSCPACQRRLPPRDPAHSLEPFECQWGTATRRRHRGRSPSAPRTPLLPPVLRAPKPQAEPEEPAPLPLENQPPDVHGLKWAPLADLAAVTQFNDLRDRDGWHMVNGTAILVISNCNSLRTCEPRHPASAFPFRSTVGFFPDSPHNHGQYWRLEHSGRWETYTNPLHIRGFIGYRVPVLIHVFHPAAGTTTGSSSTRKIVPPQPKQQRPQLDEAPIKDDDGEPQNDPPPLQPQQQLGQDEIPEVEWSTWEMGRCLRALRHPDAAVQQRALRRIHVRLWHASATRLKQILSTAGIPHEALKLVDGVVSTCKVCRLWTRPRDHAQTSSRITNQFNERLQFDILFHSTHIIGVLVCEATRYTTAFLLPGKTAVALMTAISKYWFRVFGPPVAIVSDRESGLLSDECASWADHNNVALLPVSKGSHAHVVERHHQILRALLNKLQSQSDIEELGIEFDILLAEACWAKNALTTVGGFSPHEAVFGRSARLLGDVEGPITADSNGTVSGVNRHVQRIREIALAGMASSTAQARLQRAEHSKTRFPAQALGLVRGDLVDVWRKPLTKDAPGWRGPATLLGSTGNFFDVKYQGRAMTVTASEIRKHIFLLSATVLFSDEPFLNLITSFLKSLGSGTVLTLAALQQTSGAWTLSKAAREHLQPFRAILHVGYNYFHLRKLLGCRCGRGGSYLSPLTGVDTCLLLWFPWSEPTSYRTLEHAGGVRINFKGLFTSEDENDWCWIQFMCTTASHAVRIHRQFDEPLLGYDDGDEPHPPRPPHNPDRMRTTPAPSPPDTTMDLPDTRMNTPASTTPGAPPPMPPPPWPPRPPEPRSAPTRRPLSTTNSTPEQDHRPQPPAPPHHLLPPNPRTPPTKRPLPSSSPASTTVVPRGTAPHQQSYIPPGSTKPMFPPTGYQPQWPPQPKHHPASSSTQLPPHISAPPQLPVPTTTSVADTIPYPEDMPPTDQQDDQGSLPSTLDYQQDDQDDDFWTMFTAPSTDEQQLQQSYQSSLAYHSSPELEVPRNGVIYVYNLDTGEEHTEPDVMELTAEDLRKHKSLVDAGIRKELASFHQLKTFVPALRSSISNIITCKWVHRWKVVQGQRVVKSRLTVRGFADHDAESLQTFAGTSSRWAQRLICSTAAQQGWVVQTADVSTAFLQGLSFRELSEMTGEPERVIAFDPPVSTQPFFKELPGLENLCFKTHTLKMLKCIYGLKDAPRAWRLRLDQALVAHGMQALATDKAVYALRDAKSQLCLLLSCHVDDLKITGTTSAIAALVKDLESQFGKLTVHVGSFDHCGITHVQDPKTWAITMHQHEYTAKLKPVIHPPFNTEDPVELAKPLDSELHSKFLSLLGGLSWLLQTRADVAIYIQALQRASKSPTQEHLWRVNKVLKWVKRRPSCLLFKKLQPPLRVLVLSDAAFRKEDSTGLAMRGAFVLLCEDGGGLGGNCHCIEWYSRKQKRVTRSTFAAELNALVDSVEIGRVIQVAVCEIALQQHMKAAQLLELSNNGNFPIPLDAVVDAKSVFDALVAEETKMPTESSLILILLQCKELLVLKILRKLYWSATEDMAADGLNKGAVSRAACINVPSLGQWTPLKEYAEHTEKAKRITV
jgi:Reverse transcriptase (RNA-dependent DNA polymerase)